MQIHAEHNDTMNKYEGHSLLEKYTSHFIWKVRVWEGVGDWTKTAILTSSAPPGIAVCRSRSPGLFNRGSGGPVPQGTCSHPSIFSPTSLQTQSGVPKAPSAGWWLSLPRLVSNSSDLQLTDSTELYNSSIAHSIFGIACLIVIKRK